MSSENYVGIIMAENLRFPGEGSSAQGKSGPKVRPKGVADGQQVEIPALLYDRTVGTHGGSMGREGKDRRKRSRGSKGKPVLQPEGVKRSERK